MSHIRIIATSDISHKAIRNDPNAWYNKTIFESISGHSDYAAAPPPPTAGVATAAPIGEQPAYAGPPAQPVYAGPPPPGPPPPAGNNTFPPQPPAAAVAALPIGAVPPYAWWR